MGITERQVRAMFHAIDLAYANRLEKLIERTELQTDNYLLTEKRRRLQARSKRLGRMV